MQYTIPKPDPKCVLSVLNRCSALLSTLQQNLSKLSNGFRSCIQRETTVHDKWVDCIADFARSPDSWCQTKSLWEQHWHSMKRPLLVYHGLESQINPLPAFQSLQVILTCRFTLDRQPLNLSIICTNHNFLMFHKRKHMDLHMSQDLQSYTAHRLTTG